MLQDYYFCKLKPFLSNRNKRGNAVPLMVEWKSLCFRQLFAQTLPQATDQIFEIIMNIEAQSKEK
jgi:hypothetical protein